MPSVFSIAALMTLYNVFVLRRVQGMVTGTSSKVRKQRRLFAAKIVDFDSNGITACCEILRSGGLVAFPTETVYGLGADALNERSVSSIFSAKRRPMSDPIIVHVLNKSAIFKLFDFNSSKDSTAVEKCISICNILCDNFWPGPLTIIHRAKSSVPSCVTAGTKFVGVRSPRHPVARELLKQSDLFIAAPSANRFGHVSPTSASHVYDDLKDEDITIIRDNVDISGGCDVGIESTVCHVLCSGDELRILRCGVVTSTQISDALKANNLQCTVVVDNTRNMQQSSIARQTTAIDQNEAAIAPGQMIKHYAPDIPTYIVSNCANKRSPHSFTTVNPDSSSRPEFCDEPMAPIDAVFVLDFGGKLRELQDDCKFYVDLSPSGNVEEACSLLFSQLRQAESAAVKSQGVRSVYLPDLREEAETNEVVRALWERLLRAASGVFLSS